MELDLEGDPQTSIKTLVVPVLKKYPHLFKVVQGGYVRLVGEHLVKRHEKRVGNPSLSGKRVVDVGLIVSGFSTLLINVLKSGILGDVEIKYD